MTVANTAIEKKPIRCLVIQMTRLGDTIQSLMALRAAQQLYPQLEIHFLVRERFAGAAKRISWLKEVILLPTESLIAPVISGEKNEDRGMADIARWISPLVQEPWDMVVNWSYSDSSSYLTGLLPAKIKLGYSRRGDASFSSADGWSHYVQAIIQGGVRQNIHLTDILTTQLLTALQIHVGEPENNGDAAVTSKNFFTLDTTEIVPELSLSKKWLAIQLGAGNEAKTWAPEKWAAVAKTVLARHPDYGIVILGGPEDEMRASTFLSELNGTLPSSRVLSLVGKTDFDLWASVVSKCQWILACDTAAIHLASVMGTRVLNLSIGPVRFMETGPYGNGHYVISSEAELTPEAVYATWSYAASEWSHRRRMSLENHFSNLGWKSHFESVQIYRSKVRNTNDGGGVVYEPMFVNPIRLEDWYSMVMGHIARAWYCGWVPHIGQDLQRDSISAELIKNIRELNESSDVLIKICDEAKRAALHLAKISGALKSEKVMEIQERDEIRSYASKLMELDELIERLGKTHSPLMAFSQMSKVLMHNIPGEHIFELGRESAECYRQIAEGVLILKAWIKYTMDLVKPMAITIQAPQSPKKGARPEVTL